MKRLLLASTLLGMSFGANSQTRDLKTAATPTVVIDTLHYYLNKYYFKTGNSNLATYPDYKTDATATAASTAITYCGSKFDVPAGETVTITGLEAYAKKSGSSANVSIPIHLYLFNINSSTGLPVMPAIDSIRTAVGLLSVNTPSLVGGNFTSTITAAARTMTSSFAVGLRNMSGVAGDYAHLVRTAGVTQTNTTASPTDRYSDSYGFVRYHGQFYSTKDFTLVPGFGVGTDYEFMVAPRVTYTAQASQILPDHVIPSIDPTIVPDTICTRTELTFTNTSSLFFEHRQYNLNQFYRKWNLNSPFPQSVIGAFATDSSITWHFEFYDIEDPPRDSRVFLPYINTGTISAMTGLTYYPECFTANQFRARLKPMSAFGRGIQLVYNNDFKVCFKFCNDDEVGLSSIEGFRTLKVYPNPAVNGKTLISGLEGKNTIAVYDILGQLVSKETTEKETIEINLSKQPEGTYLVKVLNSHNQLKVVKVVNQN